MPIANALAHLRANPDRYLPGGRPVPAEFATRLAGDALILGATRTLAVHFGDWWAVAADVDWLAGAPVSADELFERIVPFPQAGANSMRSEALLGAFADHVVTWGGGGGGTSRVVKGASDDVGQIRKALDDNAWQRVVAFRIEPARLGNPSASRAAAV